MKSLNWTNIIITIALFTVGWLFVPSPFHKCPPPQVVTDTLWLAPEVEPIPELAGAEEEITPVAYSHFEIHEDSTDSVYAIDMLTFTKESVVDIPSDTLEVTNNDSVIGKIILEPSLAHFRSTIFYQLGDSIAQTMHEWGFEKRDVKFVPKPVTVNPMAINVAESNEVTTWLESPVTWGLAGIIVGAVAMAITLNKKEK